VSIDKISVSIDKILVSIDKIFVSIDKILVSIDKILVTIDGILVIQHRGGFEMFGWERENHPVSRNGCHPSFVRRGAWVSVNYDNVQCSMNKSSIFNFDL
jgi:hypothetical protein